MRASVKDVLAWLSSGDYRLEPKVENADLLGEALEKITVSRPAALVGSTPETMAYFFSAGFQKELVSARAGVLLTGREFIAPLRASGLPLLKTTALISCADPYLGMAVTTRYLVPDLSTVAHPQIATGDVQVHPTAVVSPRAKIGRGSRIDAHVVIEEDAEIGEGVRIFPHGFIGARAKVGPHSVLFSNVTLYEMTEVGARVRLHSGVVLGADGFGYAPVRNPQNEVQRHEKIYHLGKVVVEDDVEIGALTSIDRGTFSDTRIGRGAKIDNNVQIGHNVQVEEGAIICGSAGVAGSARIGRFAYIGGFAGIANQVHIGDRANVGGCSLISKDVQPGTSVIGNPQREYREHFKLHARLNKMMAEKKRNS